MKDINKDEVILLYQEILDGKRYRFPHYYWDDKGDEKADIIFKYLFEEILKWDKGKIIEDFNYDMISKYKLTTPYIYFYNKGVGNILNKIYFDFLKGKKMPVSKKARKKISIAHKNLSAEKRAKITKGIRENRYCDKYAEKLSNAKLGETNPNHKLKVEQVIEIKKLWSTGDYSCTDLGEKFGVKRQTISSIVYKRTWKHIVVDDE